MRIPVLLRMHGAPEILVDGDIVDVAPHLASVATFVAHIKPYRIRGWQITNVESGLCIGDIDDRSKAAAVKSCKSFLAEKTIDDIFKVYRRRGIK